MTRLIIFLITLSAALQASANKFSYSFSDVSVPEALVRLADDHPDLNISFLYKELDFYRTSGKVETDDPYSAIRQIIGLNPISVREKNGKFYIEAMQHGKHIYRGQLVDGGDGDDPVVAATVMLLSPNDSTVLTYGITDNEGRFSIPCDVDGVIAKITCVGYLPVVRYCSYFNLGRVRMTPQPLQLKTVAVEGQMNAAYSDKSVYTPSGKQKNAAQNATDLLRIMAIPQIRVGLSDNSITDNVGGRVVVFINSLEASAEEMEGLRTADVRRVEYLEFPSDPRFHGAERVLNIIVQEYAYGGYTKATVNENCLIGLSSKVSGFSKFAYKRMTFDLYAAANNIDNHHVGNKSDATFLLKDNDGKEYTLSRNEATESGKYKSNQYPLTFRATYASDKVQIRNLIGFTHSAIPTYNYSGRLLYSPSQFMKGYEFDRQNPSKTNSLAYSGTYFFSLPKGFSLDVSPSTTYSHINDRTTYSIAERTEINRVARENAYSSRINLFVRKRFGNKHFLMIGTNEGAIVNHLEYLGPNGFKDKFNNYFYVGMAAYNFNSGKISLSIDGGLAVEKININEQKNTDTYPFTHINVRYVFSRKSSISTYLQYATNSPGISEKSPDVLQYNDVMYISGNPLLDNSRHTTVNVSYNWMPTNRLGLNAYGMFFGLYDRMMTVYSPYGDGTALLRSYQNNGDFLSGSMGVSANYKLLDGNLQLYANVKQSFYKSTGIYRQTCNPLSISAEATYFLDQFYFQAAYEGASKTMSQSAPTLSRTRNSHRLTAGWSHSDWNIRVMVSNFLNKGWTTSRFTTQSNYYSEVRTAFGLIYHPRINLTATYTFGYGKKVQRRNEIGEQEGAASAILK